MTAGSLTGRPALSRGVVIDRWFYVFMAALFAVTAFIGFWPTSTGLLAGVAAGTRPPPPLVLHVHAALMVSWLGLLLLQSLLVATGRVRWHRTLGVTGFVLAPAVAVGMAAMAMEHWTTYTAAPEITPGLAARMERSGNILLEQIRAIGLFALFVGWALLVRRRDSETHRRMMLLATLMPLSAGLDRLAIWGLPSSMPDSYNLQYGYMFLWIAPAVAYDVIRRGRPHRAYVLGLGILLACAVASYFLWSHPWWIETAPRLMGVR